MDEADLARLAADIAMIRLMAPSIARSTAPVAPPGLTTPSKRLTTMASAAVVVMSPAWTLICIFLAPLLDS
jgi:hypothetical protein